MCLRDPGIAKERTKSTEQRSLGRHTDLGQQEGTDERTLGRATIGGTSCAIVTEVVLVQSEFLSNGQRGCAGQEMTEPYDARHMLDRAEQAATAGDLASAAELLRGAARIQEEQLGPLHPDLANTLNNLAIVTERTGSASEAEALYRRAAAIAAAALPSDHPMVVESRQNLEDFCRARGLSIDAPAVIPTTTTAPPESAEPRHAPGPPATFAAQPLQPAHAPERTSRLLAWVATGAIVLVVAVLLVLRPWSSRDVPALEPAAPPAEAAPPPAASPPVAAPPAASEQPPPPKAASRGDNRNVPAGKPPATGGVAVATAQLCRTFSTSGSTWRCDPMGDSTAPGPIVLYTRVRSPRNTSVVHRWYQGGTLRQAVTLMVQANATEGYRTYSRQTVGGGDWRVEVKSADGQVLHEQRFAVR